MSIPASDKSTGQANSDLHIYITETTEKSSWLANAGPCILDGDSNRPLFGRVKFNMYFF